MLLGAEDQAELPGGIERGVRYAALCDARRDFNDVLDDGLAGVILELGFLCGAKRRNRGNQTAGCQEKTGKPAQRVERFWFHSHQILYIPNLSYYENSLRARP